MLGYSSSEIYRTYYSFLLEGLLSPVRGQQSCKSPPLAVVVDFNLSTEFVYTKQLDLSGEGYIDLHNTRIASQPKHVLPLQRHLDNLLL